MNLERCRHPFSLLIEAEGPLVDSGSLKVVERITACRQFPGPVLVRPSDLGLRHEEWGHSVFEGYEVGGLHNRVGCEDLAEGTHPCHASVTFFLHFTYVQELEFLVWFRLTVQPSSPPSTTPPFSGNVSVRLPVQMGRRGPNEDFWYCLKEKPLEMLHVWRYDSPRRLFIVLGQKPK